MAFTFEDYRKLHQIFDLLETSAQLLEFKFPDDDEPLQFDRRLRSFEADSLIPFMEFYLERNAEEEILFDFPLDLAAFGNDCFMELDQISDDIYAYIDRKGCGRDMEIINNQNFF